MIEARDLTRRYGDFTAVHGMSFRVEDGEILGILGPNGAGKTTTIRMITGFLPPSAGRVTLDGEDLHANPIVARRQLGYLPENVALYPEMRVDEYLKYRAKLAGLGRGEARSAIDRAVAACLLDGVRKQIIGTLSKGYRQRVGLAAAILHGPRVLVLDEPTVGLDPKQIIAIRELIRELGRERTLLLSTHILPEVEQLCDRVLIIDRGRLVAEGTPSELRALSGGHRQLLVTLDGVGVGDGDIDGRALDELAALPLVAQAVEEGPRDDGGMRYRLDCGRPEPSTRGQETRAGKTSAPVDDPRREVFRLAVERGWTLLELSEKRVSLEDIFVHLTTEAPEGPVRGARYPEQGASQAENLDPGRGARYPEPPSEEPS